jgi:hypothetical protein
VSEQNILNPTAASLLNFDYGYSEGLPETRSLFQSMSGKMNARRQMGRGRIYDLAWNSRDLATKHALQQWAQQYENDFFSLADWERGRYFSGRFDGPLIFSPSGNQKYNIRGRFIELPGLALFSYPTNWTRDAIFLEERNGFGEDLVKLLTPANWVFASNAGFYHPSGAGNAYSSSTTNETAEWIYFGYGFRLWEETFNNQGIVELSVTRVRDGAVVVAATNFDLYSAGAVNAFAISTTTNMALDYYRVKLRCTGTKNASSSGFGINADAIEVMQ